MHRKSPLLDTMRASARGGLWIGSLGDRDLARFTRHQEGDRTLAYVYVCLPAPCQRRHLHRPCNLTQEYFTTCLIPAIVTDSGLVDQDLLHQQASTFFRGIGAILGFRPPVVTLLAPVIQP